MWRRGTNDPDAGLGDDSCACSNVCQSWIHIYRLGSEEEEEIPRTKFHPMGFPSCWLASPALPSKGSSSAAPCVAGFSCGMPVADAMAVTRELRSFAFSWGGVRRERITKIESALRGWGIDDTLILTERN